MIYARWAPPAPTRRREITRVKGPEDPPRLGLAAGSIVGVRRPVGRLALFALLALASPALAFDPTREEQNYSKINERQAEYSTPAYQKDLAARGAQREAETEELRVRDPERDPYANLCAHPMNGCAGDVRLYDWEKNGYGIVKPVEWTTRNGATISGHVWMTRAGSEQRPGIVITNGSVQAPEQLYWFAAQTLAKRGYVVLTADPQGQGLSDTNGEGADRGEGVPSQAGRPFYDGTEDAIDFFYSSPLRPYSPRRSCTTGTSHRAKQVRRVHAGLDAAYNPLWRYFDHRRLGLAGHSFGAAGVSFVGQKDPRVKAIVAWDNLAAPAAAISFQGQRFDCASNPASRTVPPITKPALGMSADYYLTPTPYSSDPDPLGKSPGSLAYSRAHVDTGELVIRGGTHYEFSYIPNQAFGATLRRMDAVAWYTGAWFDKYVRGDQGADRRLLTSRWRADAAEAAVDPTSDGNLFSFYYRSRLQIHRADGGLFRCENLRAGCPGLSTGDGVAGPYSYLAAARTKDGTPSSCRTRSLTVRLPRLRSGERIRQVTLYVNGRRVRTVRGRHLPTRVTIHRPSSRAFGLRIVVRTTRRTYALGRTFAACPSR